MGPVSDLLVRAAARGFRTVRSAAEAGPGPYTPLLGGRAVSLGGSGTVVRVLVAEPPDRRLLAGLEEAVGAQVLLEVCTPGLLQELLQGASTLASRLSEAEGCELLLLPPGQPAVGESAGVRQELPFRVGGSDAWETGLVDSARARWCVRRRPTGLLEARRLAPGVPDLADLSPPSRLVEGVSSGSGRFCLVGDRGSGRSVLAASLMLRALQRPGAWVLAVGDPWEYPLRRPGCVVEQLDLTWGSGLPAWLSGPASGPEVLLVDLQVEVELPASLPPLTVVTASSPLPGMEVVQVTRDGSRFRLTMGEPVT